MKLRVKELSKKKGITFQEIAHKMGITYQSFNKRLNACKLDTLEEIANILNCEVVELLEVNPPFSHSYTPQGEWKGISK